MSYDRRPSRVLLIDDNYSILCYVPASTKNGSTPNCEHGDEVHAAEWRKIEACFPKTVRGHYCDQHARMDIDMHPGSVYWQEDPDDD